MNAAAVGLAMDMYIAGLSSGFGRPEDIDPVWTGVPPICANSWMGYRVAFSMPILYAILNKGEGDEVPSDL